MKLRACLLASCVILAASCVNDRHYSHPHGMPPGQVKRITHHHSGDCEHMLVNGVWVTVSSNPGNGHVNSPPGLSRGGPKKAKKTK